jgi:photosystem II stability/assembly factor-like uncharacterized protein
MIKFAAKIMKTILLIYFSLLSFFALNAQEQWKTVFVKRGANVFNDITFTDSLNGFVVGQGGVILRTTDSGNKWDSLNSGTSQTLCSVSFVNKNIGYTCGYNGTILKTIDAGKTWVLQKTLTTDYLKCIKALSVDTVYAFGRNGRMLTTTDGGKCWNFLKRITFQDINYVHFYNPKTFIISASTRLDTSVIYKTKDAGLSWKTVNPENNFTTKLFLFDSIGYAVGYYNKIYKTTDSCKSWKEIYCVKDGLNKSLWSSIYFADKNTGYVAGSCSGKPLLLKTSDGGNLWEKDEVVVSYFLGKIYIASEQKCFILASAKGKNVILKLNNIQ